MASKLRRYGGLLLLLQLAACKDAPPPVEPQRNSVEAPAATRTEAEHLVLAFGDSLYAGYGLSASESFPARLERDLQAAGVNAEVVNAGVSGDTTAAGLARLEFTLGGLRKTPDLAIVGLGGNDMLRGIDPAETERNLEAILTALDKRGIPVVLTGMMAPRNYGAGYVARFDRIYPSLARRFDAPLDPFFLEGVITRRELMLDDGIHPNARGVEVMAKRLAPIVARELKPAA